MLCWYVNSLESQDFARCLFGLLYFVITANHSTAQHLNQFLNMVTATMVEKGARLCLATSSTNSSLASSTGVSEEGQDPGLITIDNPEGPKAERQENEGLGLVLGLLEQCGKVLGRIL
ncbi:hypothetical protein E2C01_018332 [Portunus trituberculatus]|uniref:Uncharacterized protein n=1 Tax=Portunus trituberculatus TaxID=210409 RepID=A0A5B7DVU7_PORTR|nr:hypothetical protein [Portunus trituberculatus]